jgi:predicted CopG family antitoxin
MAKLIRVSDEVYARLVEDKEHFKNTIGGGRWAFNDVLVEYLKILNTFKEVKDGQG